MSPNLPLLLVCSFCWVFNGFYETTAFHPPTWKNHVPASTLAVRPRSSLSKTSKPVVRKKPNMAEFLVNQGDATGIKVGRCDAIRGVFFSVVFSTKTVKNPRVFNMSAGFRGGFFV